MSLVKSVFHLFQQHRFLRTSATVNVLRTQCSCRNACTSSGSTNSSSEQTIQLNPTGPENHDPLLLSLLKLCGFSDAKIVELVAKDPRVLESNVGNKTLKPKQCSRNTVVSSSKKTLVANEPGVFKSKNPKHEAEGISFFKSYGFSDAHVAKLVAKDPGVLKLNVDKILKPLLDCLADYGFSGSFIHDLVAADPKILRTSLDAHLQPTLSLLETVLGSRENVVATVKLSSYLLRRGNKQYKEDNLNFLVSEGVPLKSISRMISLRPRLIMYKVDRMVYALQSAKQFGFRPDDPMLFYAMEAIISMSESAMYKKKELLKDLLGLSEDEVNSMFKRCPQLFCNSEDKMKNVVNFFVNTMQAEPSILLDHPLFFSFSVDKKLVPRYNVYKVLESKKLFKREITFATILRLSEKWFESKYVVKNLDQLPNLMEIYHGFTKTSDTQSVTNTMTM